jgi:hypothetical protein
VLADLVAPAKPKDLKVVERPSYWQDTSEGAVRRMSDCAIC